MRLKPFCKKTLTISDQNIIKIVRAVKKKLKTQFWSLFCRNGVCFSKLYKKTISCILCFECGENFSFIFLSSAVYRHPNIHLVKTCFLAQRIPKRMFQLKTKISFNDLYTFYTL